MPNVSQSPSSLSTGFDPRLPSNQSYFITNQEYRLMGLISWVDGLYLICGGNMGAFDRRLYMQRVMIEFQRELFNEQREACAYCGRKKQTDKHKTCDGCGAPKAVWRIA